MTRKLVTGIILLFPMLFAACSSKQIVTEPTTIYLKPPQHLMMPTPEPVCTATTNGVLLDCYLSARDALRAANADKAAMRSAVGDD